MSFAHEGHSDEGVVGQRIEIMEEFGAASKSLSPMFRGRLDWNVDTVVAKATYLRDYSGQALLDLFPEGSDGAGSDAKAAIWADWEDYSKIAFELEAAAAALVESAPMGMEAASNDFKAVSATCRACHMPYRK
jgi:cytochrome c556